MSFPVIVLKKMPKVLKKILKKSQPQKILKKKHQLTKNLLKLWARALNLKKTKNQRVQKNLWKKKLKFLILTQKKLRTLLLKKIQKTKKGKALIKSNKALLKLILIKSLSYLMWFKKCIQKKPWQPTFSFLFRREKRFSRVTLIKKSLKSQKWLQKSGNPLKMKKSSHILS